MKIQELVSETMLYVTSKNFVFQLSDEESETEHQFGVVFEIIDMYEASSEKNYKDYGFIVSAQIVADSPHKSYREADSKGKLGLIYDTVSYMGGVPIDHFLTLGVKGSNEIGESAFDALVNLFTPFDAKIVTETQTHGTWATQRGSEEIQYLQFKNYEAARRLVDHLVSHRLSSLGMMIGFILDRPINMIGDSGWSVMDRQVKGDGK